MQHNNLDYHTNKAKMLNWANQFNIFCMLDNNNHHTQLPAFECLLAVGCQTSYNFTGQNDFEHLLAFYNQNPTWLFGHLGYNAANNAYKNTNSTASDFSQGFFFEPIMIVKLQADGISILKSTIDPASILAEILSTSIDDEVPTTTINIVPFFSKQAYINNIIALQKHIKRGDCYEINFCQPFFAKQVTINAVATYLKLVKLSPTPFAAFYKNHHSFCLCASPERFLQKIGTTLLSQPIKGTSVRSADPLIDAENKNYLLTSEKEKSENVMVVDLVRNDLSTICTKGSVMVKELFGIYSFTQVHQMISTVVGTLPTDKNFTEAIKACYPMGSMTGAPKHRVMELIEEYEPVSRGLFSGSIGYIKPNEHSNTAQPDFDFNVVIRSIFYNKAKSTLHFFAGSGITFYSRAEEEYEECLAKANAIITVLKN